MVKPTELPTRIAARIRIDAETGCWLWTGATNNGYGQTTWPPGSVRQRNRKLVHRLVYELLVGSIAEGMVPDHLCGVRLCVKAIADEHGPAHLEVVTVAENTRRGSVNQDKCRAGLHPWEPWNIRINSDGSQRCRECARVRERERSARRDAAGLRRKARPGPGQPPLL